MQTITENANKSVHSFIDSLIKRKMYGEVTFFMQAGIIESCRVSQRHTMKEMQAMADDTKVLTPIKKENVLTGR